MIVPSVDLMDGQAVQLIGGREKALEAGDPLPLIEKFGRVAEVAVIDLDAALGRGSNAQLIAKSLRRARCRVGGGIRSADKAKEWLDLGAEKVILGTAARPEVLRELPASRVIAALDAVHGEVVVDGWRTKTGKSVADRIEELSPYVSGFLVTFVEREGRMEGVDLEATAKLKSLCGKLSLTVAGGVTTSAEIKNIDRLGADCQIGMALYTGRLRLAEALSAVLEAESPNCLWPTVVTDESGFALGLVYSSLASLNVALETGQGVYQSRKRGIWKKGETSGATQELLSVSVDCDRDALRFRVRQAGAGFCHKGSMSCFADGPVISALLQTLEERKGCAADEQSYTARLFREPELLRAKLLEEAAELAAAETSDEVLWEAADVLYFSLVAMARSGVSFNEVETELRRRSLRVSRRGGDAKLPRSV